VTRLPSNAHVRPRPSPTEWAEPLVFPDPRLDPTTYRPTPSMWREMRDAVLSWDAVVFVGLVVVILALSVVGWEPR
jgi:hypothetical protein